MVPAKKEEREKRDTETERDTEKGFILVLVSLFSFFIPPACPHIFQREERRDKSSSLHQHLDAAVARSHALHMCHCSIAMCANK